MSSEMSQKSNMQFSSSSIHIISDRSISKKINLKISLAIDDFGVFRIKIFGVGVGIGVKKFDSAGL
jgi:hypothetical protein